MERSFLKMIAVCAGLLASASVFAQTTVSGIVVDQSGAPVIGAAVIVSGTTNGSATDIDGKFTLKNVSSSGILSISSIGYESQEVAVANQTYFRVTLAEDTQAIEETVVIGYGVQKKSNITGSISSVKGEMLQNRPVETVQQALSGKVAGVQVYQSNGAPGSDPAIRVRGIASNNTGSSNPLYVVDGLKVASIAYLDPSMIESMEVLKDGASAAIYGAEAGNGVILITTKTGSQGESRIFYDYTLGLQSVGKKADVMNAEQYAAFQKAAGNSTIISRWDGKTDTDWTDTLYGDGGTFQRHTLGFEGGNGKGSLYAAVSYVDNDGIYYGNKDFMKRLTFQVNAAYKIKPWIEFTTNNSIESSRYSNTQDGLNKMQYNSAYIYDPLTPDFYPADNLPEYMKALIAANGDAVFMKNENGDYAAVPQIISDRTNPMTWYYSQDSLHQDVGIRGTTALNFTPIKGLTYTSRVGYYLSGSHYNYYGVPVYFSISPRTKLELDTSTGLYKTYDWENFANYNRDFGKNNISVMAGMSYHHYLGNFTSATTDELQNTADNFHFLNFSTSSAVDSVGGEETENANISYFGRIGYTYDNRYSIQATFRADAYDSSKLSKDSRWGYFPSVSLGWIISNEEFMESIRHAVSFAKLRASYGINGNINVLGDYAYTSSLSTTDYYPVNGQLVTTITPSSTLANPSLRWETSKQFDLGLDLRFLANRLSFTADFFNKDTDGQLISMTAPLSSGTNTVIRNVGLVNNHGVEFELGWKDQIGDFSYSISAQMATLSNKVKSLGDNSRIQKAGLVYFDIDQPVWSYYGYNYLGVAADGTAIYEDNDGQEGISTADMTHLGSPIPTYSYGLTISAAWKGLDFSIFGSGAGGNKIFFNATGEAHNRPSEFWTNCYSVAGASAKFPIPATLSDQYMSSSSMFLYNGSFFKIKQIAIGYTVPQKITRYAKISNFRVFASLDNYFCFTSYPGFDPEAIGVGDTLNTPAMGIDSGDCPTPKTFSLGVNLAF
ncbi:MAG: TonB-dependent receptor [Bacteroidales bacterium]|nr:TonB-dependent receptor [Bacteroidales bacterium]